MRELSTKEKYLGMVLILIMVLTVFITNVSAEETTYNIPDSDNIQSNVTIDIFREVYTVTDDKDEIEVYSTIIGSYNYAVKPLEYKASKDNFAEIEILDNDSNQFKLVDCGRYYLIQLEENKDSYFVGDFSYNLRYKIRFGNIIGDNKVDKVALLNNDIMLHSSSTVILLNTNDSNTKSIVFDNGEVFQEFYNNQIEIDSTLFKVQNIKLYISGLNVTANASLTWFNNYKYVVMFILLCFVLCFIFVRRYNKPIFCNVEGMNILDFVYATGVELRYRHIFSVILQMVKRGDIALEDKDNINSITSTDDISDVQFVLNKKLSEFKGFEYIILQQMFKGKNITTYQECIRDNVFDSILFDGKALLKNYRSSFYRFGLYMVYLINVMVLMFTLDLNDGLIAYQLVGIGVTSVIMLMRDRVKAINLFGVIGVQVLNILVSGIYHDVMVSLLFIAVGLVYYILINKKPSTTVIYGDKLIKAFIEEDDEFIGRLGNGIYNLLYNTKEEIIDV